VDPSQLIRREAIAAQKILRSIELQVSGEAMSMGEAATAVDLDDLSVQEGAGGGGGGGFR